MEGLPSTRSVGDLPAELHCPLCKDVMKDAVLTSKCCFNSFCDTCKISSCLVGHWFCIYLLAYGFWVGGYIHFSGYIQFSQSSFLTFFFGLNYGRFILLKLLVGDCFVV